MIIPEKTKKGYAIAEEGDGVYINRPHQKRGVVQKGMIQTLKTSVDDIGVVVVDLKRGYSCEVKEEKEDVKGIDIIGNYSKSNFNQTSIVNKNGISPTVTENHGQVTAICENNINNIRIRKLTPKECFRLMGFDDEDFEKAKNVNSNAQLYKQAGNSIIVNVLMAIFKELL